MNKISARFTPGIIAVICFLLFSSSSFAKIIITDPPEKIEVDKEFELGVSLNNLSDPSHYLSIALHKNSGDPYFGLTKNADNWIEADDANCRSFPPITITEGSWSGKLTGKIVYDEKDFDNTLGNYILKVFKYTDSCNKSSSGDLAVVLYDPDPPPTLTPTFIPTAPPTILPTNTHAVNTSPPKPQNTMMIYPSPTIKKNPAATSGSIVKISVAASASATGLVLGEKDFSGSPSGQDKESLSLSAGKKSSNPPIFLFILIGILFFTAAVVVSVKQIRKNQ